MDPSTPILYSDDEDDQMKPTLPKTLDECVDPYDQTEDFKEDETTSAFIQICLGLIGRGTIDDVKKIIKRSDYHLVWEYGWVMSDPIENDDAEMVKLLVETCPDREKYLQDGKTFDTDPYVVKHLRKGIPLESDRGKIPLREAIEYGSVKAFNTLIELGIRVDPCRFDDEPVQQLAIHGRKVEIMQRLLDMGYFPRMSYLFKLWKDRPEIVKFVLENSWEKVDNEGRQIVPADELLEYFDENGLEQCSSVLKSWMEKSSA